jgi:protein-S-isoprenylcysteine O-methyltransferase Ste14
MLARALLAFLALPGLVAFAVPALIVFGGGWTIGATAARLSGAVPFTAGVVILLWCVRDFYATGRGTLAPWDPPKHLVTVGLYRRSRNPMYVGVILILIGWAVIFAVPALWVYAALVLAAFHLRVLLHEEPFLSRVHGAEWERYRSRVPRWLWKTAAQRRLKNDR